MKNYSFLFFLLFSTSFFSQNKLDSLLKKHNSESVPYISVDSLKSNQNTLILLDAREENEYKTSHLKNAFFVGFESFKLKEITKKLPNKKAKIVVYCSLGIRSEKIANQLKKAGYLNVFNLYGGIFEWKNNGNQVYDSSEKMTENVHAFNKEWGKWLLKGHKIYE